MPLRVECEAFNPSISVPCKKTFFPLDLKEQSQDFEIHYLNSALKDAAFNQKPHTCRRKKGE